MIEAQSLCPANHPLHKPIDWNNNGMIDALPVIYGGIFSSSPACVDITSSADHNDYAALKLQPTSLPGSGGAPTPGEDSGACAPVPEEDA